MQRNLDEAQARASETERKLGRVLGEYISSNDKERGRPHYIMDKMWQMMQSKGTKTLNLDKDLEEIMNKVKQAGCRPRRKDSGHNMKMKISNRSSALKSQIEGTVNCVAEWFSREELKALQGVCVLTSVWAREWAVLINLDDQVWKDFIGRMAKVLVRKRCHCVQRCVFGWELQVL